MFFVFSVIGTILGAASLAAAMPMLDVLFEKVVAVTVPPLPDFEISTGYAKGVFNHYFKLIIIEHEKSDALLFICVVIVSGKFLENIFKYSERLVASKLRIAIVKNLRKEIFSSG